MLKLTASQLSYLLYVQSLDDWHPQGLLEELFNQKEEYLGNEQDFSKLIKQMESLSVSQIEELQAGLNRLATVPVQLEFTVTE